MVSDWDVISERGVWLWKECGVVDGVRGVGIHLLLVASQFSSE